LPFQEHGVKVKFRWYDAFDESVHHSQYSIAFEKASILFNLGALLTKLADEKFQEAEDFAKSYQYFQYAAGIYKFIQENFLHSPSQDLSVKTVQFLTHLQLAQAQEVFLLKLISEDSTKKSLISRLAISSSQQYTRAQESLDKIDEHYGNTNDWNQILKFKTRFYLNFGYYNYALSIEDKKVGVSIALLKTALEGFKDLKKYENPTTIDYKSYITLVDDKLRVLVKDNDFIYHDTIPSKESLDLDTLVKPLDASKPIALNDQGNISEIIGDDIFEKIIPAGVHEKLSLYSEEKAKILREQLDKTEMINIELESFLEYLRLPQSLSDFKNTNNSKLDPKLITWSNEVIESSLSDIEENKAKVNAKREEILNLIKALGAKLDQEEDDFNSKRYELNSLQEPSTLQSANLKDELINAKQSLLSATKLDTQINETIEPELRRLDILKSKQRLQSEFFSSGANNENLLDFFDNETTSIEKVNKSISKIEEDLRILKNLKKERENKIEELKTAIHEDDISNILVLNSKNISDKEEKALFQQELTKFTPLIKKIDILNSKQPDVIKNVKIHYDKIITSNNKIAEKAQKIASFEMTYNNFKEYEVNYGKSVEFYKNLLKFVQEIRSNIEKFVSDRYLQRQRILSQSSATRPSQPSLSQPQFRDQSSLEERTKNLSISSQSPRGSYMDQASLPPQRQPSFASNPGYPSLSTSSAQPPQASPSYRISTPPANNQPWSQPLPYEVPKPQPHVQPSYQQPPPYQVPPQQSYQQPYYQQSAYGNGSVSPAPPPQQQQQPPHNHPQQQSYDRPSLPPKPSSSAGYSPYGSSNPGYSQPYDPNNPYQ
jgi:hypothetical protein